MTSFCDSFFLNGDAQVLRYGLALDPDSLAVEVGTWSGISLRQSEIFRRSAKALTSVHSR